MKLTTYYLSKESLSESGLGAKELIISPKMLSRIGKLSQEETLEAIHLCHSKGIKTLLEWDILMTQNDFPKSLEYFKSLPLDKIFAVRVQDPGALNFLTENFPKLKIQLILETGNHNWEGIKRWIDFTGNQLDRVILSIELQKGILSNYLQKIHVPVELLGLGKILLFYTPRNLLSPRVLDHDDRAQVYTHSEGEEFLEALASSEETPHKGFKIVENTHGTFMFHPKEHCLVKQIGEMKEMGISYFRVDNRFQFPVELGKGLNDLIEKGFSTEKAKNWMESYPRPSFRGFYSVNKTDVLFPKLKNWRIQRKDELYLGDILDTKKDEYLCLRLRNSNLKVSKNDTIEIRTPEGKLKTVKVRFLKNTALKDIEEGSHGDLVLVPPVGGVSVRSSVYLSQ